jgi:hypothetical protein
VQVQLSRGRDAGTINHRSRGANTCGGISSRANHDGYVGMLENDTESVDSKSVWKDKRDAASLVGKNVKERCERSDLVSCFMNALPYVHC